MLSEKKITSLSEAREAQQFYVNDSMARLTEAVTVYASDPENVLVVTPERVGQLELTIASYAHAQWQEVAMLQSQVRMARLEREKVRGGLLLALKATYEFHDRKLPNMELQNAEVIQEPEYARVEQELADMEEALTIAKGFMSSLEIVASILPGCQGQRNTTL